MTAFGVFSFYLAFFYGMPLLLFMLVGWHDNFKYHGDESLVLGLAVTGLSVGIILWAANTKSRFRTFFYIYPERRLFCISSLLMSAGFLALALYMRSSFDVSFRHVGPELSKAGVLAQVFSIVKALCVPFVILYLKLLYHEGRLKRAHRLSCLLFALGYMAFPIAAFDAIFLLLFMGIAVLGQRSLKLFQLPSKYVFFMLLIVGGAVIVLGLATKVGFVGAIEMLFMDGGSKVLNYLQYRQGVYFFSSISNYSSPNELFLNWWAGWKTLLDMLGYRLDVLMGGGAPRPEISNLNVLNFTSIFAGDTSREGIGASPGLASVFIYFLPFPLSIFLLFIFVRFISLSINCAFPAGAGLGFILPILICMLGIFNNPVHVFTAIGPDMLKSIFLLWALLVGLRGMPVKGMGGRAMPAISSAVARQ